MKSKEIDFPLYKITLMDENIPAFCSAGAEFFTENIEEFEQEWMPHIDDDKKERYCRSKAGEQITDTYGSDPENVIFQKDENAKLQRKVIYTENDCHYKLVNAYGWPSDIYADRSRIEVASVKFKGSYYLIGKYRLEGVCQEYRFVGDDIPEKYEQIMLWGNPVFRTELYSREDICETNLPRNIRFPRSEFARDVVETYCWICLDRAERPFLKKDMRLTRKFVARLMRDIPGEAG